MCFCQQRLGIQSKCEHAMSDNVDVISSIIADQSRDFLQADSKFNEDIKFCEEGLKKVEFARSQNYLSELAVYV